MPDLSPKQLEVLAFIRRFMESGGLPPTRGEIAEGLRLRNRQGIDQHLRALAAKGAIELIPGISRGIRLAEAPQTGCDSMKDADILDRDLLAVHRTNQARNGQIVVARIDDEATVKYYRRQGQLVRLEAANPAYAPIEIDLREQELSIEGLATGVVRTVLSRRS
jgi:repressor LexA